MDEECELSGNQGENNIPRLEVDTGELWKSGVQHHLKPQSSEIRTQLDTGETEFRVAEMAIIDLELRQSGGLT